MTKVTVYNQKGEKVKDRELAKEVFAVAVNEALVHQAAMTQLANERQVLAHTKVRSEVRGGGRKPWRQKGTGRARAGSSRSPIWVGGGVTFGPRNDRNFSKKINAKMKKKALAMVLSDKVAHQALAVVDAIAFEEAKTKHGNALVGALEAHTAAQETDAKKAKRSVLVIADGTDAAAARAFRNLAGVKTINGENINIIDLLTYRTVIATEATIDRLEKRYQKA